MVVGSALSPAIIRDTAGPADSARTMGQIGTVMALAPMVGPLLGGLLDAAAGWRATFALYTLCGLIGLVLIWTDLGETHARTSGGFRSHFQAYPEVLSSLRFWSNALCMAFAAATFYVFLSGAPLVAASQYAMSPAMVGVAMAVTPVGFMLGNIITTRLTARMPLAAIMVTGRLITVAGLSAAVAASFTAPAPELYFGLMVSVGIGNGMSFPPGYAGVMSVRPEVSGSAAGLSGALMVAMGALMTWGAAQILTAENALSALALLMLAIATAALIAAIFARRAEIAADARPLETDAQST